MWLRDRKRLSTRGNRLQWCRLTSGKNDANSTKPSKSSCRLSMYVIWRLVSCDSCYYIKLILKCKSCLKCSTLKKLQVKKKLNTLLSAIARGCNVIYPYSCINKSQNYSLNNQQWPSIIFFIRFYREDFHCYLTRKNSHNKSTSVFFIGTRSYNGFVCNVKISYWLYYDLRLMSNQIWFIKVSNVVDPLKHRLQADFFC